MKSDWRYKKIGDVCEVVSGSTPKTNVPEFWGTGHYWVTPAELDDTTVYINKTERQITDAALNQTKLQLLPIGTVLLSSRAPIGKVAIANTEMYCNQGFKNCICSEEIYNKFLFYFFKYKKDYLNSLGRGATFKEISKSILEKVNIPLPSINTQKSIVAELDKTNELIALKKLQLTDFNRLAQSIFYNMFGDPVVNEKGWEKKTLKNICSKITDGTHDTPERVNKGIKFITGKHIRPYYIDYENSDYVTEEIHKEIFLRCNPEFGDVLYTNIGAGIGNAALNTVEYEFSMKNVALLKPQKNIIDGYFIEFYLNNDDIKSKIIDIYSNGGAQRFLSLKSIAQIPIVLPPLSLQLSFAARISIIEQQKQQLCSSIQDLETLLNSRMQHWFD